MKRLPFALLGALALISGCHTTDTRTDWSQFNTDTVTLALEAVASAGSLYVAEYYTTGVDAACQAAVGYLEQQEGLLKTGIARDSSVWVFFRNDFGASILEKTFGTEDTSRRLRPEPAARPSGGETVGSVLIVVPFEWELPETNPDKIAAYLDTCMALNVEPVIFRNGQALVANIKQALETGIGTLFWSGHGNLVPPDTDDIYVEVCVLLTGESYTKAQEAAGEITSRYPGLVGPGTNYLWTIRFRDRFWMAVMPGFIETHGKFDQYEQLPTNITRSIAYVSCCFSEMGMAAAFLDAGADVYCGYTWAVSADWARDYDNKMFELMCDTCTAGEAAVEMAATEGVRCPDPWKGEYAEFRMFGDSLLMVRSQMRVDVDGAVQRCHGVSLVKSDIYLVAGEYGPDLRYNVGVDFPAAGTWDCTANKDAMISWADTESEDVYFVAEDLYGVSGTITVTALDAERAYGTFEGTLWHWEQGQNPREEPPASTKTIGESFFKVSLKGQ